MSDRYATRASLLLAETVEGQILDQMDVDTRAGIQVDEVQYAETYKRRASLNRDWRRMTKCSTPILRPSSKSVPNLKSLRGWPQPVMT